MYFYSRPCGRGDRASALPVSISSLFLLTPLREGRPDCLHKPQAGAAISTHAPAGGATGAHGYRFTRQNISTHAPAGGATRRHSNRRLHIPHFYSRPCGRGDGAGGIYNRHGLAISTHAPAGGATSSQAQRPFWPSYFYSRPCGRGDVINLRDLAVHHVFLLTPLREGRPQPDPRQKRRQHFYSRPCGRGDISSVYTDAHTAAISTHAPAGGATIFPLGAEDTLDFNFYSRPCGRGDAKIVIVYGRGKSFLLTPLREGRPSQSDENANSTLFLLTPLREGRLVSGSTSTVSELISTHAPAGGATRMSNTSRCMCRISTHAPAGGAT